MLAMERVQIAGLIISDAPRRSAKAPAGAEPFDPIAGRSMLEWVVEAALGASVRRLAIVAESADLEANTALTQRTDEALVEFVARRSDTVESMAIAIERVGPDFSLRDHSHVLVLSAEAPQIEASELRALIDDHLTADAAATLLGSRSRVGAEVDEPMIERDASGQISSILEPLGDAVSATSIAIVRASLLLPALRRVTPTGWTGGPLLSDALIALEAAGHSVVRVPRDEPIVAVTSTSSRALIEMQLRDRIVANWIERGVTMTDPRRVSIDAPVMLGQGVEILPGTLLEGTTVVGDGAVLGPNSHLVDATIGTAAHVPNAVVRGVEVPPHERVRPFSVLGADTD